MKKSKPRFAALPEILGQLREYGLSEDDVALLLDAQTALFPHWESDWPRWQTSCGYRSLVRNGASEILGTVCGCPTARPSAGVACTRPQAACSFAHCYTQLQARNEVAYREWRQGKRKTLRGTSAQPEQEPPVTLEELFKAS